MSETQGSGGVEKGAEKGADKADTLPAIDFSTFVLSLSTSALYQMGLVNGPEGAPAAEPDLLLARQTIDTLKMLRAKTVGNLDEPEQKLIDNLLYELHTHYTRVSASGSSD